MDTYIADDAWMDEGLIAVDLLNPNSFASSNKLRSQSRADVIILQERKKKKGAIEQAKTDARLHGWRSEFSAAQPGTANSASAGVAVLVKSCYGSDRLDDTDLFGEPHRACAAETSACDGCLLVSLYLRDSEGASPQNLRLMEETAELANASGRPCLIAMDANMSPDELMACNWPGMAKGKLIHTDDPTCGSSTYDMFLAGGGLERAVTGVQRIIDSGTWPHT